MREPDDLFDTLEETLIRIRDAREVIRDSRGHSENGEDVLAALRAIGECLPRAEEPSVRSGEPRRSSVRGGSR